MVIGIEASRANRVQKTGVEWYAYQIIQSLKQLPEAEPFSWLLYANDPLCMGLERNPSHWHERCLTWPPKYLWTQLRLSYEMSVRPPDVLFVPAHVLPRIVPKRTVVTIHDVGFHRHPEFYKPRQVAYHEVTTRDIVARASRILTVSHFSKQELVDLYHADPEKITVTPLGIDHAVYTRADASVVNAVCERFHVAKPYFLFVGRLETKKNILTALEAFRRYKETRGIQDPMTFVFAGPSGAGMQAFERAYQMSCLGDMVRFTGYISEAEKIALYSGATALVHPSWYEGFGLTPLEAMACGCAVVCSNAASLPEVAGSDTAYYFDPADTDGCLRQLLRVVDEPLETDAMRARASRWVRAYDWRTTARQTLDVLTQW